ncbi:MAG: signal peptide peptidase SppA [Ignavibacteria bacterium]|nr:signal peptide peptidase SppA [Ignavibacteria bacterium]
MEQQYNTPPPVPKKKNRWIWIILIIFLTFAFIFAGIAFLTFTKALFTGFDSKYEYEVRGKGTEKIAIVDLDYSIYFSESLTRQFKKYREDKSIKAIILRVNSPGGGTAASHEMYEEIKKTRDSGKPVIVSVSSVAASGAYYASCGANIIVANPSSLVGSIGVIIQYISMKDLADKLGIKDVTVKSGELKDTGNPLRDINEKDKEYLQDVVNDSYELFLEIVSRERKINLDSLREIANGRIFTGRQGLKLRLIDTLGTFDDAVNIAAKYANIEGEPKLVKEKSKKYFIDILLDGISKSGLGKLSDMLNEEFFNRPLIQYKFEP